MLASDEPEPRAAAPEPRIGLASGVARLPLPAGWKPLGRRSSLPGLEQATAVRGAHSDVALDIRAPEDPSLLPASVEAAVAGRAAGPGAACASPPAPRGATTSRARRPGDRVVALALPTTGGVVTIACASGTAAIAPRRTRSASRPMDGLQLDGASALTPAPETAAAIVLPATIAARLNRRRRVERRDLAATRLAATPERGRRAASRAPTPPPPRACARSPPATPCA